MANKILVLSDKDAKDIKSRLDNEEVFTVPNLELKDGKYSFAGTIEIRNRKDYYAYIRKHKELVEFLYENFDPYVINNYRKNLAVLFDPTKSTNSMKMLSGATTSSRLHYEPNPTSVLKSFLNTYNAKKVGIGDEYRIHPLVKKVSSDFMASIGKNNSEGFVVPMINENGLVAHRMERVDGGEVGHFDIQIIAIPQDEEITQEALREYLALPFGGEIEDEVFDKIRSFAESAYESISNGENKANKVKELLDYCMEVYGLHFVDFKKPSPRTTKAAPASPTPVTPGELTPDVPVLDDSSSAAGRAIVPAAGRAIVPAGPIVVVEPSPTKPKTPAVEAPVDTEPKASTDPVLVKPGDIEPKTPAAEAPVDEGPKASTDPVLAEPGKIEPKTPAVEAPVDEEPKASTEPVLAEPGEIEPKTPAAEAPVDEEPKAPAKPKYRIVFKKVPVSNIRDFETGDYKYYSNIEKMVIEEYYEEEIERS